MVIGSEESALEEYLLRVPEVLISDSQVEPRYHVGWFSSMHSMSSRWDRDQE